MEATIERSDICYLELIGLIESVGFCGGRHYLYCRVKNADGRGKLFPIEHAPEVETLVSMHSNEKKINLCVFREKPSVDIETPGSHLDVESGSSRNKRKTVSGILSSKISNAQHLQYRL
jgi:hypothetical protein